MNGIEKFCKRCIHYEECPETYVCPTMMMDMLAHNFPLPDFQEYNEQNIHDDNSENSA